MTAKLKIKVVLLAIAMILFVATVIGAYLNAQQYGKIKPYTPITPCTTLTADPASIC